MIKAFSINNREESRGEEIDPSKQYSRTLIGETELNIGLLRTLHDTDIKYLISVPISTDFADNEEAAKDDENSQSSEEAAEIDEFQNKADALFRKMNKDL
jgi:hypothetical protein